MRLKEFKSIFEEVLSKEDYSEMEKVINYGLALKRGSISQLPEGGSESLQKLLQELPKHYNKFKKINDTYNKIRRMEEQRQEQRQIIEELIGYMDDCLFEKDELPASLSTIQRVLAARDILREDPPEKEKETKKAKKIEERLVRKLRKTYSGKPYYNKKWLERETLTLKQKLSNNEVDFGVRFLQTEGRLAPYDKLRLHKEIEQHLKKECASTEKNPEAYKTLLGKFGLAQKAGVQVAELKKQVLQDVKKTKQELEKLQKVNRN